VDDGHHRSSTAEGAALDRIARGRAVQVEAVDDWVALVAPLPTRRRVIVTLFYVRTARSGRSQLLAPPGVRTPGRSGRSGGSSRRHRSGDFDQHAVRVERIGNGLAPGLVDRIEIPARTG
jgi:hypothetical protein